MLVGGAGVEASSRTHRLSEVFQKGQPLESSRSRLVKGGGSAAGVAVDHGR